MSGGGQRTLADLAGSPSSKVVIEFSDDRVADYFITWFLGHGEQDFYECGQRYGDFSEDDDMSTKDIAKSVGDELRWWKLKWKPRPE